MATKSETSTMNLSKVIKTFNSKILSEMLKERRANVTSPMSITCAMMLLYVGSNNNTRSELAKLFELSEQSNDDVINAVSDMIKIMDNEVKKDLIIKMANGLFLQQNYLVRTEFVNYVRSVGDIQNVNFAESDTYKLVNEWISNNTNGMIKDLLGAESIKPETRGMLVNTLYFSDKWREPFDAETIDMKFTKMDGSSTYVPMMRLTTYFKTYNDKNYNVVIIPYKSPNFAFCLILPKNKGEQSIFPENPHEFIGNCISSQKISLVMPKFIQKYKIELCDIFKKLGVNELFTDNADLSNIYDDGMIPLKVSSIKHEVVVEVDTDGTKAAAVTCVYMEDCDKCLVPIKYVHADHSFMYCITYLDNIIFCGIHDG